MSSEYATAFKRKHHRSGFVPLSVVLFRNGELDVCLETGEVFRNGRRLAIQTNRKGYCYVQLGSTSRGRRRRENAWVHRLVKMKAIAVGLGGSNWRNYVRCIGHRIDVNHVDGNRGNNVADNLELQTDLANRMRRDMTEEEWRRLIELEGF